MSDGDGWCMGRWWAGVGVPTRYVLQSSPTIDLFC